MPVDTQNLGENFSPLQMRTYELQGRLGIKQDGRFGLETLGAVEAMEGRLDAANEEVAALEDDLENAPAVAPWWPLIVGLVAGVAYGAWAF